METTTVKRSQSLATRLLILFIIAATVPMVAVGIFGLAHSYVTQRDHLENLQQESAKNAANVIDAYLAQIEDEMNLAVRTHSLETEESRSLLLDNLMTHNIGFETLILMDKTGREVAKTSRFTLFSPDDLDNRAGSPEFSTVSQGARYLGPVSFSQYGEPVVSLAIPARDTRDKIVGVLLAEVNLKHMWDVIARVETGPGGYAYVVDSEGTLIAHRDSSLVLQGRDLSEIGGVYAALQEESVPSSFRGLEGQMVIGGYQRLQQADWSVLVEVPVQKAMSSIYQAAALDGAIIVVALVLAGLLGRYTAQLVVKPLSRLQAGAETIGEGELEYRIDIHSQDEIGALAGAFNNMADRLRETIASLQSRSQELEERTREIEASQRVTFAASERADPERLLRMVVNLIRDQFHLYHAQVYIVDEEKQAAVLRQSTGYAGRRLLQQKHHISLDANALVIRSIHSGEPVLVDDVSEDESFMPNPLLPDTRSELVVPLKVENSVVGVLDAQAREPGRFTENTVALFRTMADQIAFLFENSELVERVTEQRQAVADFAAQLRSASDIARRTSTILDPNHMLQQTVELMQSRFGLYHVHVYVLDEDAGDLVVRAGSGEVGRVLRQRSHSIPLSAPKSLVARAARDREIVLVEDTTLESDFVPNPLLPQTRAEMAAPLVVGDRVLGVLDVQDDQPGRFAQAERDTFSTLAGQLAAALQNAAYVEELQQAAEELREMDRLKSEFMANMSHELRTPLNSIIGYAELMLMGVSDIDPDTLEDVQAIYSNGRHLLSMINDILDMSKIEAGGLTLELEPVQIEPLIDEVSAQAVERLEDKPITWSVDVEPDLPSIQADPLRIDQILNKLATNAEKFTEEGEISLRAWADSRDDGDWVCIEIQDTGIGIAEADMDKVFDRFQQVDSSSTRTAGGAGLGLAITRRLVELHGGAIEVQSQPGEGSTFTVRLPVQQNAERET